MAGPGQLRDIDNTYTMSDWDGAPLANPHQGSQIFSGALWNLRQQLGTSIANVLIFEGLDNLNQSAPNFQDGREAIIAADLAHFSGNHISTIEQVFDAREIYEPYSFPGVVINGPGIVQAGQSGLSWEANVYGGRSPFHFEWELDGSPVALNHHTIYLYFGQIEKGMHTLKVTITDDLSNTASDIHMIQVQ